MKMESTINKYKSKLNAQDMVLWMKHTDGLIEPLNIVFLLCPQCTTMSMPHHPGTELRHA